MGYTVPPADVFSVGVCMFMMLTARPVWKQAILADPYFHRIYSGGDAGLGNYIVGVLKARPPSAEAMDLMVGLLKPNPNERLDTDAASKHRWFHQQGYTPDRAREQSNRCGSSYVQRLLTRAALKSEKRESTASTLYLRRLTAIASKKAIIRSQLASVSLLQRGSGFFKHDKDSFGQAMETCLRPSCLSKQAQEESDHSVYFVQQAAAKVSTKVAVGADKMDAIIATLGASVYL
jgi:serine/threonine protein kinase